MVLSVAYALLAAVLSGRMAGLGGPSKPGAAARPVGIYDPYDADGCADCACHGKALCEVRLSVAREMKQPLMLQFQLEAFYQNHRRYLNSVSHAQLSRSSLEQQSSALDYEVPPPRPACRTRLAPAPHPLRTRSAPAPHPPRSRTCRCRAPTRAAAARAHPSARPSADGHLAPLVGAGSRRRLRTAGLTQRQQRRAALRPVRRQGGVPLQRLCAALRMRGMLTLPSA